ncbi:MAG: hypothetical protein OEY78_08075 [Gammaproteobacteria bacterium]|nr:hypothetical protein [Gammaproteobacteria bacterium]
MSKSLDNALSEDAWSVSAIIADLNDKLDDEGRPISERRADAAARVDVEMEMRQCPFEGIRQGKWMNVSALTQITNYYKPVLAEMAAFRRQAKNTDPTWDDILASVVDLLAGPAIYLLQKRNSKDKVPAQVAVGHKLAAGMFGVLREVHQRVALGNTIPLSVDSFLELVDETDALVGAAMEACAGSPAMIRKASVALIEGHADDQVEIDPLRLDIAHDLALQIQLGIFWKLYDQQHLWSLLRGEFKEQLVPCNQFLQSKIENAAKDLDSYAPPKPDSSRLPAILDPTLRLQLIAALDVDSDPQQLKEDLHTATNLLNEPGSVIGYNGDTSSLALSVANYLNTYRLFKTELSRLEQQLRGHLGFASEIPVQLGGVVFPIPQALPWYELILGRRLGEDGHLTGKNTKIAKK